MTVTHATFTLERTYQAAPARVFAAWADPATKARWFSTPTGEHKLDFRVGGREVNRANHDGQVLTFESWYQDIVTDTASSTPRPCTAGPNWPRCR